MLVSLPLNAFTASVSPIPLPSLLDSKFSNSTRSIYSFFGWKLISAFDVYLDLKLFCWGRFIRGEVGFPEKLP
ncbi:unnamed protein product [Trifolium pratense]|uniref:Uncharacterized protein n=1 Tax=Trifolium pratense TaxID=57577 RepID=A0ACB0JM62_TRIPR|nr:unnamed protein product [Trifolium pratense]